MQPQQIFTTQPVTVPAGLVKAIFDYIGSRPSVETALLTLQFQQVVGAQMQAIENAAKSAAPADTPADAPAADIAPSSTEPAAA